MRRSWLLPVALGGGLVGAFVLTGEISGSGPVRGVPPSATASPAIAGIESHSTTFDEDDSSPALSGREPWAYPARAAPSVPEPWDDVAGLFGAVMGLPPDHVEALATRFVEWPEEVTPESLRRLLGLPRGVVLTYADVLLAVQVSAPFNARLADLGREFAARLEAQRLDAWRRGDYLRFPRGAEPDPRSMSRGIHALVAAGHGWTVYLALRREECPEMLELVQAAYEERQRRDLEVRRVLAR